MFEVTIATQPTMTAQPVTTYLCLVQGVRWKMFGNSVAYWGVIHFCRTVFTINNKKIKPTMVRQRNNSIYAGNTKSNTNSIFTLPNPTNLPNSNHRHQLKSGFRLLFLYRSRFRPQSQFEVVLISVFLVES